MKKILTILAIMMVTISANASTVLVYTSQELYDALTTKDDDGNYADVELMADMDLSGLSAISSGDAKGYLFENYNGSIHGRNHVLKNSTHPLFYSLNNAGLYNFVLEGFNVTNATSLIARTTTRTYFSNITVKNSSLTPNDAGTNIGMIAGWSDDDDFKDCKVKNDCTIKSKHDNTGGIVGYCEYANIVNCYNAAEITSSEEYVGGIAGHLLSGTVSYCHNAANITSSKKMVGGIAGDIAYANITYCYNTANITSGEHSVGGVAGYAKNVHALYCLNTGTITGEYYVGGIIGHNYAYYTRTVSNNVHTGSLQVKKLGTDIGEVGGIMGECDFRDASDQAVLTIEQCMNWGKVDDYLTYYSDYNLCPQIWGNLILNSGKNEVIKNNYYYCKANGDLKSNLSDMGTSYEAVMSGELAYTLLDGDGKKWLYQDIDNYTFNTHYPTPIPAAGTVYSNILCDGTQSYSNKFQSTAAHTPTPDQYGYCTICGNKIGNVNTEIHIKNADELIQFAYNVNKGTDFTSTKVFLDNDIDLSGKDFNGIGGGSLEPYPFKGTFDGQGYRIKNWTVTSNEGYGLGFFRRVSGENTVIKNLIIDSSCSITSTGDHSGTAGLVGYVTSTSGSTCNVTIINCGNEATITGYDNVAGILGGVYNNESTILTIENSYNTGAINGQTKSATLCAIANCSHTFTNCYNSGTLTGVKDNNYFYRTELDYNDIVRNCYDINGAQTGVAQITSDQITSGELCSALNKNSVVFSQNIATDTYPIPGTDGLTGITILRISNAEELITFANSVNAGTSYASAIVDLDADIDLTGKEFPVIGRYATAPFMGTFNGQGHRIKNMTLNFAEGGIGLFGCASGINTVIKNVIIDSSCSVTSTSGAGVAGLLGEIKPFNDKPASVTIENCGNEATITGVQNVAGIIGGVFEDDDNSVTIRYCYNTGSIKGQKDSSTLGAYLRYKFILSNCYNTGTLTGQGDVGAFYGCNSAKVYSAYYCYDVNGSQDGVTKIDPQQVVSGEVCYLLNTYGGGDHVNNVFSQDVTTQTYPLPGTEGLTGIAETHISTADELISLANEVNAGNGSKLYDVYLDNDIELEIKTNEPSFPIIGNYDTCPFKGTFNGQGHRIKNMILNESKNYTGFFGVVAGANTNIKNLVIDSSCSVTSTNKSGYGTAGLIGCVASTSGTPCNVTILNCGNEAPVTGGINTAGLLGGVYNNDNAKTLIYNSYNSGAISGSKESASICGYIRKIYGVMNCYNSGTLTGGDGSQVTYRTSSGGKIYFSKNSYDVNGDQGDFMEAVTAKQVRLGQLCQKLNDARTEDAEWAAWTQDLENDTHPVFGDAGIHYTRTMKNQWGTICLPFDAEMGDEYDFYELSSVNDDYLTVTKVTKLAAGTPAILRRNTSATGVDIPAVGTTLVTDSVVMDPVCGLTLTGTFTNKNVFDEQGYLIMNNAFWLISYIHDDYSTGAAVAYEVYCPPFRAYLAGSIPSGAKMLNIGISDDTTTALDALNAVTSGEAEYFDLSGHKLNDLQKGINIIKYNNGVTKKVIVK